MGGGVALRIVLLHEVLLVRGAHRPDFGGDEGVVGREALVRERLGLVDEARHLLADLETPADADVVLEREVGDLCLF